MTNPLVHVHWYTSKEVDHIDHWVGAGCVTAEYPRVATLEPSISTSHGEGNIRVPFTSL